MPIAYIGLGSNLGDRATVLQAAVEDLDSLSEVVVLRQSPLYETAPEGLPPGAPAFLNGVVEVDAACPALDLLQHLMAIETRHGRVRHAPGVYESRTLDLDLLLYGSVIMQETDLILPHPRLPQRRFVLQPLCDLCPDLIVPGLRQSVHRLLAALDSK